MSTKPLYSAVDVEDAKKSSASVRKLYSRRAKRRKTVQIRIGKKWHGQLKEICAKEQVVMSLFLDKVCKDFFSKNPSSK